MASNIYTSQFATAEELKFEVSKKVGNDEIISRTNQGAETIKIYASKIDLQGYVTVSDLSDSGKTTINGSNITTGTISADRVSGGTLLGTTISGNTIIGGTITIGKKFIVTADGDLTCENAKLGGIFEQKDDNGNTAIKIEQKSIE